MPIYQVPNTGSLVLNCQVGHSHSQIPSEPQSIRDAVDKDNVMVYNSQHQFMGTMTQQAAAVFTQNNPGSYIV